MGRHMSIRTLADLHLHSKLSDGLHAPSRLVAMAAGMNLGGIALTDHDTLDGLPEFMTTDGPAWLVRVPGVEISTYYKGRETHILGYFVPEHTKKLKNRLLHLEESRKKRFPKMLRKLNDLGITITQDEIEPVLRGVKAPGRPHLARVLVTKGIVKDYVEAFDIYLGEGRPAYVERDMIDTEEAIALLRSEDAVPVLAHPLTMGLDNLREVLTDMRKAGLLGVEVKYVYDHVHISSDGNRVREAACGLGLIETGGSDHHGDDSRCLIGEVTVPLGVIDALKEASKDLGGDAVRAWARP